MERSHRNIDFGKVPCRVVPRLFHDTRCGTVGLQCKPLQRALGDQTLHDMLHAVADVVHAQVQLQTVRVSTALHAQSL